MFTVFKWQKMLNANADSIGAKILFFYKHKFNQNNVMNQKQASLTQNKCIISLQIFNVVVTTVDYIYQFNTHYC